MSDRSEIHKKNVEIDLDCSISTKDAKYFFDMALKSLRMEFNMTVEYLENLDSNDDEGLEEAIDYLNQAISLDPLYVDAYILLAVTQVGMCDNESAIDNYTAAIELDPNNSWAYYWRAEAKKDNRDIILDLNESIKVNPNNFDAYYSRASVRKKIGDYQGASEDRKQQLIIEINNYSQKIALNPNDFEAYSHRANAKRDLGDYQGSIDDRKQSEVLRIEICTQKIALNPNDFEAYSHRANAKRDLGDYQGSIDDRKQSEIVRIEVCTQRVALNPNDFETYQFRARAKNYLCDYLGAIEDYKQAIIALKENDNDSNTALFILYSELLHIKKHIHNWQGVIDVYTELIKLNVFESHYFYCERAQVKYDLGYYLGAIEDCTQIINSKSDITRAYFLRASAKKCLGNYQEALDDCDLAIYRCKGECEYLTRLLTLRNQIV